MGRLIEFLQTIEKKHGMYFGGGERSRSIRILQAFIVGFDCGRGPSPGEDELAFFSEWTAAHYGVLQEGQGLFSMILEHVDGDERRGWDEFFKLLPQFLRDRKEIGIQGIMARFDEVQEVLLKKIRDTP